MKVRRALALAILFGALAPTVVAAHAQLLESTPAADAVVTEPVPAIVLTFDDPLLPSSSFDVVDAAGTSVAMGSVDPADAHSMRVDAPGLANGDFEVRWTAATADGHIERGTYQFTVAMATPEPATPEATVGPVDAPSAASSHTPSPAASLPSATQEPVAGSGGEASSSDVIVSIAAALVVLAGGAFWLMRRRGPQA